MEAMMFAGLHTAFNNLLRLLKLIFAIWMVETFRETVDACVQYADQLSVIASLSEFSFREMSDRTPYVNTADNITNS